MKHKKIKAAILAITAIAALGGILYSSLEQKNLMIMQTTM